MHNDNSWNTKSETQPLNFIRQDQTLTELWESRHHVTQPSYLLTAKRIVEMSEITALVLSINQLSYKFYPGMFSDVLKLSKVPKVARQWMWYCAEQIRHTFSRSAPFNLILLYELENISVQHNIIQSLQHQNTRSNIQKGYQLYCYDQNEGKLAYWWLTRLITNSKYLISKLPTSDLKASNPPQPAGECYQSISILNQVVLKNKR